MQLGAFSISLSVKDMATTLSFFRKKHRFDGVIQVAATPLYNRQSRSPAFQTCRRRLPLSHA